jgi:hypothetical protein
LRAARRLKLAIGDLAVKPTRAALGITAKNVLKRLIGKLRIGNVDVEEPARIVERVKLYSERMLPITIAVVGIPSLGASELVHIGLTLELSGHINREAIDVAA